MRIAVTGSSGQIGSPLVEALSRSYPVEGFDLVAGPRSRLLDMTSASAPGALRGFDVVCHLAARIPGGGSPPDPRGLAEANLLGAIQALEAARANDARFLFFSSVAVYGNPVDLPVRETHPLRPITMYGVTKLAGEQCVALYQEQYGLDAAIVRPFNVYSDYTAGDHPPRDVLGRFLQSARSAQPLVVNGDGQQTRDFIHVSDVVQLVELLVDGRGKGGVYNVGTGSPTKILDLAGWIRETVNPSLRIVHGTAQTRDVHDSVANIERAQALGFRPKVRLRDWLASLDRVPAGTSSSRAAADPEK